jgi:Rrf2 family protein
MAVMKPNGFIVLEALCDGTDMPTHYVSKVMQLLVRGGLVKSRRGSHGGFALTRSPDDIHLNDIIRLIDGVNTNTDCCVGFGPYCDDATCPLPAQMRATRAQLGRMTEALSLRDLADAYRVKAAADL